MRGLITAVVPVGSVIVKERLGECLHFVFSCANIAHVKTLRDTTAERIRSLRIRNGISQQGLADRMNHLGARVDRSVIAKVEGGKRAVSLEDVFRLRSRSMSRPST